MTPFDLVFFVFVSCLALLFGYSADRIEKSLKEIKEKLDPPADKLP
jgi:hypothetical protein